MSAPPNIYILAEYANQTNLGQHTYAQSHVCKIGFSQGPLKIDISETNSLIEDKYSLHLKSSKYVVEGNSNIRRESGIHHHGGKHSWKHLQFTLQASQQTIRIKIDGLDEDDYRNCIKGFLFISQKILEHEKEENKIKEDLVAYFYNEQIKTLNHEGMFLLGKIEQAFSQRGILDDKDKPLDVKQINELKKERHLLPFLEW